MRRAARRRQQQRPVPLLYQELASIAVFVARRVLDTEVAATLAAESVAYATLHPRRLNGRTPEETVGGLYAIARSKADAFVDTGQLALPALRLLRLPAPELDDTENERLAVRSGIAAVRSRTRDHLDELPPQEREPLRMLIVESRSRADVAHALELSDEDVRSLSISGLLRIAERFDARRATGDVV